MAVLLVTFETSVPGQDYVAVQSLLKHYKHVRLAEGSYAIETYEATRTVYNKITRYLNANTHVYVLTVTKPFTTQCVDEIKMWLGKHLPQF